MNRRQKRLLQNAKQGRHSQTGQFEHHAHTVAGKGFADLTGGNDESRTLAPDHDTGDGRDTVKGGKVDIDLDGDGDGPTDDYWWRNIDESGEQTDTGDAHVGGKHVDKGVMNANPEGINQYSHAASNKANQATGRAKGISDAAVKARGSAEDARHASEMGDSEAATAAHRQAAIYHSEAAKNPGVQEKDREKFSKAHASAARAHDRASVAHEMSPHEMSENSMTAKEDKCPECGGEMDENGECEDCGYTENAFGQQPEPAAPVAQPDAHAATVAATTASMDHPPARAAAVKAFDHSKGGKSGFAAAQHGNAAAAHDDAMQDSINDGNQSAADAHGNAAMLHRKAAAMHGAMTENDFGPAAAAAGHAGEIASYAAILGKSEGSYPETKADKASHSAGKASAHADKTKSKSAHLKAGKAHRAAASEHKKTGMEQGPGGKIAHHEKMAKSHFAKAGKTTRNMITKELIDNCRCPQTKAALVALNAKQQGSNADVTGSGDFDDALEAGGWDDSPEDDEANYKNDDEIGEDSEDDADDEPLKTGGDGATDKTRGRTGVGNQLTVNQAEAFSRAIFGKPLAQVREEHRMVQNVLRDQKIKVIRQLVGHLPKERATAMVKNMRLLSKPIEELRDMLAFQRPQQVQNAFHEPEPVYLGGSFPVVNGERELIDNADDADVSAMVPPTINFRQWADEDRATRNEGGNYAQAVGRVVHTSAEAAM